LKLLFLEIDYAAVDVANEDMLSVLAERMCLSCHGSWEEVVALTVDIDLPEEWLEKNPHIGIYSDFSPGHEVYASMHILP